MLAVRIGRRTPTSPKGGGAATALDGGSAPARAVDPLFGSARKTALWCLGGGGSSTSSSACVRLIVSLKELAEPAEAESEDEPERPRAPSSNRARTRAVAARRRELAVAGLAAATLVTVAHDRVGRP
jgi:hypothetical protein